MSKDHSHSSAAMRSRGRLSVVLCLSSSVVVVQVVGAVISGSLALLADAVHIFADTFGIGLALVAVSVAARPTKAHRTFGLYRLEILATVANGLLLLALSGFIFWQAIGRWFNPVEITPGIMIAAATYGVVVNLVSFMILRSRSGDSLAVKGAYLEVMSDMIGSLGVVIAGIVVLTTGYDRIDSIASVAIALFMVPRIFLLLRRSLSILMENAPTGLDLDELRKHLLCVDGVAEVHDLHAWTITSGMPSLSAHVIVDPDPFQDGQGTRILDELNECVHECFEIGHTTFQLEAAEHAAHEDPRHP